jgi:hypothetical protein
VVGAHPVRDHLTERNHRSAAVAHRVRSYQQAVGLGACRISHTLDVRIIRN